MTEPRTYCVILTTCPSHEEADKIATLLIREHAAACVQVTEIVSYYEWKQSVNTDAEQLLFIKAGTDQYERIEQLIRQNHSYEVPEIVQIPIIKGSKDYLNWIDEVSG